jgi:starch synthase
MRVIHVCSELFPLLKTGGLADVTGALPAALGKLGCDARVLLPGFPKIMAGVQDQKLVAEFPTRFGAHSIKLYFGVLGDSGVFAYVIDAPELYNRLGNPYADVDGQAYGDNYLRFALLGWMAARLADGCDPYWRPQVVHSHDWHAGLAPAYLRCVEQTKGYKLAGSVFTVHNLAYQGVFPSHLFGELRLPVHFYNVNGSEFFGQFSFLKSGLFFADKVTTVSPTYAQEIQGYEQGCGLDGLLRTRAQAHDLSGVLNGVDDSVWNPATDKLIPANYTIKTIAEKRKCKTVLQQEMGLTEQNDAPLFCVVSRLTEQKGLHLILATLPEIVQRGGQIMILGAGDPMLEQAFLDAAKEFPQSIAVRIGYDEKMAHRIIAGSDVIMVPSRFEPCGLTQLYGLKYGTIPLVHRVGGLADTVVDSALESLAEDVATGVVFEHFNNDGIRSALRRAFALFKRKADWKQVQKRGMAQQFGWDLAARDYLALYEKIAH